MSIEVLHAFGNPYVGVFITASEKWALIPESAPDKVELAIRRNLGVEAIRASIGETPLLGILCVMNSKGLLLGNIVKEEEVDRIRKAVGDALVVDVLDEIKENALGNLILTNDSTAIVSPLIPPPARAKIADTLDVEVVQMKLGGSNFVGALGVATNRGVLLSPILSDEEVNTLISLMKVPKGGIGTVNRGNVFVKSGVVANSRGALVGFDTTGIEMMRIQASLF
ncbi:MAG: translation initiation factor IF-6 [Thermofilaceae archaeon]